jgi:dephospho-CoA kinase
MPGSGKGEFAAVLSNDGIPIVSMGDMVRAEVRSRNLPENPGIFGEIAAELRADFGEDVLAVRLGDKVDELLEANSIVLIEGLRGDGRTKCIFPEMG